MDNRISCNFFYIFMYCVCLFDLIVPDMRLLTTWKQTLISQSPVINGESESDSYRAWISAMDPLNTLWIAE